jgi:DMSO/TMAO reductase YedYZ heme-binding membrane subunit
VSQGAANLNNKIFNGWGLFWLISGPVSIAIIATMLRTDLSGGEGVSSMIQLSVRCAIPWLYLAFAASSVQVLFPREPGRWLLRNRKYIGLCFAAAMAWQLTFIVWLTTVHTEYYVQEVYVLRDVFEGVIGYFFLIAMTLTSFKFWRMRLNPRQWKHLHKIGIYSLWIYAFSVYWWALYYYPSPLFIDYAFYWVGFFAWFLRALAWRKKRRQKDLRKDPDNSPRAVFKFVGGPLVVIGLVATSTGLLWATPTTDLLTGYTITRWPELYLPYWPFEPFLPVFMIAAGIYLTTKVKNT